MNRIHVVQVGPGPIGQACVRELSRRPGIDLAGGVDVDREKAGGLRVSPLSPPYSTPGGEEERRPQAPADRAGRMVHGEGWRDPTRR